VSVIPISNMVVRPRSQNPCQLASPRSSVAAGGRGASAVGVDESGVLAPAAFRARRLTQENILGSCSTRQGEIAVPHKCFHSSATSSCRICTSPPVLYDRACSMVILAPRPSQATGISSGEWLYRRRTLSLHSSTNRPLPFTIQPIQENRKPCASGRGFVCPVSPQQVCPSLSGQERGRIRSRRGWTHIFCTRGTSSLLRTKYSHS
jgi:hypothetical protein